jgi:hypothetical protein
MGNHAFFGESKYNNLPRVKRFKTVFLIEPSFENASAEVCLRENVGSWRIHQWLLVFYLENSNR